MCKDLGGLLNYPCENFIIDICFPEEKIAIEYDGSGHDLSIRLNKISEVKFKQKENFRKKVLYKNEYKIITFMSNKDIILSKEESILILEYCKKIFKDENKHHADVNLDNKTIEFSHRKIKFDKILQTR